MGKHNTKTSTARTARNAAIAAAAGVSAAVISPATANAAPALPDLNTIVAGAQDQVNNYFGGVAPQSLESIAESFGFPVPQDGSKASNGANPGSVDTTPIVGSSLGQKIANAAQSKIGSPYAWGAAGPSAFDCSGLTSWAYQQVGKSIPRTSSAQASAGTPVSLNALQPGDVISYYSGASHVGIYIGNGKIVHALNESTPVRVDDLNFMPINNAVRF